MWRYITFRSSILLASLAMLMVCITYSVQGVFAQNNSTGSVKFATPRFDDSETSEEPTIEESEPELPNLEVHNDSRKATDDAQTGSLDLEEIKNEPTLDESIDQGGDVVKARSVSENGKILREPYDVYKENGHYFVDWEKPELALVFTGMTNGYIEPCGCAGMDRMKGGLSRRATFLKELRNEKKWDVATIDTGQITIGFGVQEELKFDMAMNAFNLMGYDAIGLGKGELRFPAYFLLTFTAPTSTPTSSLFTSANVGVYGYHETYTLPYKIINRGGLRIGVMSVVCGDETTQRRDENLLYEAPERKILELMPKFKKEKCDKCVLIVHGTEKETLKLAKQFPVFDYIVTSDTPSEPPAEAKSIGNEQKLIEVGEKGKYAIVVGLYKDGSTRYQRVALDSRYESSSDITLLMKDYQSILKGLITTKGYRGGLGVNPARSPQAEILGKYVGAQKCRSCHEESYRVWAKSRHAHAWKSLTDTANPPRDYDPECISCHVVGWDGLQHFPYINGYSSAKKTPELLNVGCESCHGPGERHMAAELDSDESRQERIRSAMRLGDNAKKVCYLCHDGDNSPAFNFEEYYPLIEHMEKDYEDEDLE